MVERQLLVVHKYVCHKICELSEGVWVVEKQLLEVHKYVYKYVCRSVGRSVGWSLLPMFVRFSSLHSFNTPPHILSPSPPHSLFHLHMFTSSTHCDSAQFVSHTHSHPSAHIPIPSLPYPLVPPLNFCSSLVLTIAHLSSQHPQSDIR